MNLTGYVGALAALAGAALDLSYGYSLLAGSPMMGSQFALGGGVMALGAITLVVGASVFLPGSDRRAAGVGFGMEVSGVLMIVISAWSPGMGPLTGFAMLAVGGLMILTAALMQRQKSGMKRV